METHGFPSPQIWNELLGKIHGKSSKNSHQQWPKNSNRTLISPSPWKNMSGRDMNHARWNHSLPRRIAGKSRWCPCSLDFFACDLAAGPSPRTQPTDHGLRGSGHAQFIPFSWSINLQSGLRFQRLPSSKDPKLRRYTDGWTIYQWYSMMKNTNCLCQIPMFYSLPVQ